MEDFEKLGAFYLGKHYDLDTRKVTDNLTLYDSRDLTTHAVCVGMTGSGKTGLCVGLLEEAAIDGIPAIIIDPKGDMTNLLLTFPELMPADFLPWIHESEAERTGLTVTEYAEKQAATWKKGLESWGQSTDRIRRLKSSAEFAVYTPGSTSGLAVSILSSFQAPPEPLIRDEDAFGDKISTTVTSILGLLDIDADPVKSREYILLSSLLNHYWRAGQDLDLSGLIHAIQSPPISKIGVFDLESIFPTKDRMELAMTINNLLASPSFQAWLTGEPLDIDRLLYTAEGKPRHSIFYISHLSDSERMFFVSLLLNQLLGWMRTQPGTGSLRALLYIDELFGYMPPVENPSSKKPLLTLLKQARAFGLGVVVATQNPVDLDYKGLSNIGTWFIGRLQTDRDRDRILDGLAGSTGAGKAGLDRPMLGKIISSLDKRVFLMHNVHEDVPEVFNTRWVMSYLAGPLTRVQIKDLMPAVPATGS
ncbi:MAG: ATP-binding protein, partial [Calditrichaeota bacterium]